MYTPRMYSWQPCHWRELVPEVRIHLHCFTGTRSDVEDWLEEFPNCYFGFTARASTFNHFQLEGLRSVTHDRILVETDSPYMPVEGKNHAPAYIGDVAQFIARLSGGFGRLVVLGLTAL